MASDHKENLFSVTKRWDEHNYGPFQPSNAIAELRETTVLRVAKGLEFTVDKEIAPLIEASWKSGIFIFQSDTWSNVGTIRLHIASAVFADQFLANIFADGDIYWKTDVRDRILQNWDDVNIYTKVVPEDWDWSFNFEFMLHELEDSDLLKAAFDYFGKTVDEIQSEMENEPSVIVRFPCEFKDLLTERLLSKETFRPDPNGMIWNLLPDLTCFDSSYFF